MTNILVAGSEAVIGMWHVDYDALFGESFRLRVEEFLRIRKPIRNRKPVRRLTRLVCIGSLLICASFVGRTAYANRTDHQDQMPPDKPITGAALPQAAGAFENPVSSVASDLFSPRATPGPAAAIPFALGFIRRRRRTSKGKV